MKKIISMILSTVIVLTSIISFNTYAVNTEYESFVVDVLCNYPYNLDDYGLIAGVDALSKHEAHFMKEKDGDIVYLSINDIEFMTRSKVKETANGYNISQGHLSINLNRMDQNIYYIDYGVPGHYTTLRVDSDPVYVNYIVANECVYIEPEVVLSLLSAECSFMNNNNKTTLLVDLPQYTLFEAMYGPNYNKYFVGNLLTQGITDDENIVFGVSKFLLNFKRLYNQYALDAVVNLKYELINPFGEDRQVSAEMAEAYAQVLGYDIETDKKVAETETNVYKGLNNIDTLVGDLVEKGGSDNNNVINFYIDSYAHTGARDNKSLKVFDETLNKLSDNEEVMSKLNKAKSTVKSSAKSILKNTVIEYIKRRAYDKNVLVNYKNTFSEEARNIVGLKLSDDSNDKLKYESAMKYYETCFSDSALLKDIVEDEVYSKIMKSIVMIPLDWSTGGAASEFVNVYKKVMSTEELREMNSSFKPLKNINNASDYMFLTVMQRMIADVEGKAIGKFNSGLNQNKNVYDVLIGSLDMYYRTSIVMIKTLKDSWQFGALSDKEKDIIKNADQYISELAMLDYKINNCRTPDFSESTIKSALKNEVFKNEFSDNGIITGKVLTEDSKPIKNSKIEVYTSSDEMAIRFGEYECYTNNEGEFSISMPEGKYLLVVTCDGYDPVNIKDVAVEKSKTTNLNDVVLKKENKQIYSAEELIDKSIPEIIKLMNNEFELAKLNYAAIAFQNDDVFPGLEFRLEESNDNNTEFKDGVLCLNGKDAKDELKTGKYELSYIVAQLNNAAVTKDIKAGMSYKDITDKVGELSATVGRPPHIRGTMTASGLFIKCSINRNGKTIELYFPNNGLLKNESDIYKTSNKTFTYDELINADLKLFCGVVYKPHTDWKTSYKNFLNEKLSENGSESYAFDLYDVNDDGIPELFVSTGFGAHANACAMYTIEDNKVSESICYGQYGNLYIDKTRKIVVGSGHTNGQGGFWDEICEVNSDNSFVTNGFRKITIGAREYEFYINGDKVSEEDYNNKTSKYQDLNTERIGRGNVLTSENINSIIDNY